MNHVSPRLSAPLQVIGEQWREGNGVTVQPVIDPSTGATLAELRVASPADVDEAVAAAAAAFEPWRRRPAIERSRLLRDGAALIRARSNAIARLIALELGKPFAQALVEVETAAEMFDWAAEEGRRCYGRVIPRRSGGLQQRTELVPLGVVAAASGWNAPAITPARKISSALATGCTLVLKPSEETPHVALAIAEALRDAGLPPGVLNLLFGDPAAIMSQLIAAAPVRALSFTGGTGVGRALGAAAGGHLKRATLELGGHAPVLVFDDVDVEAVARSAAGAKFRNAGQVCTSPTRFVVHEAIHDRFAAAFVDAARAIAVGPALEPGVQMGPLKNPRRVAAMQRLVDEARAKGLRLLVGGQTLPGPGCFFSPTLLLDPECCSAASSEEPFGPLALLRPFATLDEAVAEANRLPAALAAYAFTRDLARAHALADGVRCGALAINDWAVSTPETPFGGMADSGYGLEGGSEGLREFMQVRSVRTGCA